MKKKHKKDDNVVILFSGGADSVLMLEIALDLDMKPHCVLIKYGQLHIEELDKACEYLKKKKITWDTVTISGLNINSGLTGDGIRGTYEGVNEWHVPSRNLMFVSIAASIAESKGIGMIWLGADWDDYLNQFADCKQEWLGRLNRVLKINGSERIRLEAPLSGMSKDTVNRILRKKKIDKNEIFSGYGDLDSNGL